MKGSIRTRTTARLATAALTIAVLVPAAQAAYTITMSESAGNVVASGTGSFNLTGLTLVMTSNGAALIDPGAAGLIVGPSSLTPASRYSTVTGPANFGPVPGTFLQANSGSGSFGGIDGTQIVTPAGYASGANVSGTATWTGKTFATLGVTPGTYTWTWGTGPNADSLVLQIGPTAPPPSKAIPTLSDWAVVILATLLAAAAVPAVRRRASGKS